VGRVWPRHGHRGRPLNADVNQRKTAARFGNVGLTIDCVKLLSWVSSTDGMFSSRDLRLAIDIHAPTSCKSSILLRRIVGVMFMRVNCK